MLNPDTLPGVCLVPISDANRRECLRLRVDDSQSHLVATNEKSLAEAAGRDNLHPLAIYDQAALGYESPTVPMIGFAMYELVAGVGFLLRLMIDGNHQRQGYGRAATVEVIRRLKLHPEVQLIATSCRRENVAAERLFRGLGFIDWDVAWAADTPDERYLMLPG